MLVGLAGKARSGKDTAGEYLVMAHGFQRFAFADLLKESVAQLFDISMIELEEMKLSKSANIVLSNNGEMRRHVSVRGFLQRYGTEAHREVFAQNFWVDQLFAKLSKNERVVITDVRFPNEAERIREHDGKIIELQRFNDDYGNDPHASEQPLPGYMMDWQINNNSTLDDLYKSLDVLVRSFELAKGIDYAG